MKPIHIDIGVGGRFHADHMARAFLGEGYSVRLFTSYPKSRFPDVPKQLIHSLLIPELAYRGLKKLALERWGERAKMRSFGALLGSSLCRKRPEGERYTFIWSSFALESFRRDTKSHKVLVRDSTHIMHQMRVLTEANASLGMHYEPDKICVNRELEEYQLADSIIVLSHFAKKTFIAHGIAPEKISVLPLGVNTSLFKPSEKVEPFPRAMHGIYFGTISVRKGIHHLLEATKDLPPSQFRLTLVGPIEEAFRPILARYRHFAYYPAMPHSRLSRFVAKADLYLFPTLEDGFPNTLIQAMGAGLVPITTGECGPAEYLTAGEEGFIVKSADVEMLKETLVSAIKHPAQILAMREKAIRLSRTLPWSNYQRCLIDFVEKRQHHSQEIQSRTATNPKTTDVLTRHTASIR